MFLYCFGAKLLLFFNLFSGDEVVTSKMINYMQYILMKIIF